MVWRRQARFMHQGVAGLTRDKTRPSRIPPLPAATVDRVVALTNQSPPNATTHWTAPALAKAVAVSSSSVGGLGGARVAAASGAKLQDLQRSQIRRQAEGCRRSLRRSAGSCRGSQHRREKPDPGARPLAARTADEEGALCHHAVITNATAPPHCSRLLSWPE